MRHSGGALRRPPLGTPLLAAHVPVVARDEVEEVLPRALRLARAERVELSTQDVALRQLLDERHQLILALARHAGRNVHDRVRVRADEVDRPVGQLLGHELRAHGSPPAPRQPRVADVRAAEHPHPQRQLVAGHERHPLGELRAPCLPQARPVVRLAAELRGALLGSHALDRPAGGTHALTDLVPLDLERHQRRDEVVDVRHGGKQHRERPVASVVPAPAPRGRLGLRPRLDVHANGGERLDVLAHHDQRRPDDAVREAPDRVEERAEVQLVAVGERVQAGSHRPVRWLEHAQPRLAAGAQQRGVRPLVELDLVAEAFAVVGGRCNRQSCQGHWTVTP